MLTVVELLGFADVVRLLGLSRTRVEQLILDPDFPRTHHVGERRTRVWDKTEFEDWAESKGRVLRTVEDTPPDGVDVKP